MNKKIKMQIAKIIALLCFGISFTCVMMVQPNHGWKPDHATYGYFMDNSPVFIALTVFSVVCVVWISMKERRLKKDDKKAKDVAQQRVPR